MEGKEESGFSGVLLQKLIACEMPAVHVKGPRLEIPEMIENEASIITVTLLRAEDLISSRRPES